MKEELISYKTAVLAKEKGFENTTPNQLRRDYYNHEGVLNGDCTAYIKAYVKKEDTSKYLTIDAPTQSLLQKWLREEYNFYIGCIKSIDLQWSCHIDYQDKDNIWCNRLFIGESYEETLELALYEALKLIN